LVFAHYDCESENEAGIVRQTDMPFADTELCTEALTAR
jgi:hypothetical protein